MVKTSQFAPLLAEVEAYFQRYVSFPSPDYAFAGALYAAATHLWPHFDAFPYMVITSATKRSGKTRFSEVLSFVAANARNLAGITPATVFRMIKDEKPTLIIDEAESLSGESAGMMRTVLNVGYRRGQTVPRTEKNQIVQFDVYCPKVFILIGDVFDTLRDRSIIIRMKRAEAPQRFLYEIAKNDGEALRDKLADVLTDRRDMVIDNYMQHEGLDFLPDRDEEIWLPLFAVCSLLAPERLTELKRVAVDMATEKTQDVRRYIESRDDEAAAADDEYARRLLRDLLEAMGTAKHLFTADALPALHGLTTAPWRKYKGEGLTAIEMSNLLSRFNLRPKLIKVNSKRKDEKVARGYRREDVEAALKGA